METDGGQGEVAGFGTPRCVRFSNFKFLQDGDFVLEGDLLA